MSTLALVGAPNSGKTSLYNWLTGSKFRTVNYPGSTVEYSLGETLQNLGPIWRSVDTPGLYSLSPKSPDEEITVRSLFDVHRPEVVVAVVDATQLARHLVFVRHLQESFPVVVALTMMDIVKAEGKKLQVQALADKLKVPCVELDGRTGKGSRELLDTVRQIYRPTLSIQPLQIWSIEKQLQIFQDMKALEQSVTAVTKSIGLSPSQKTEKLDRVLLHPQWGIAIFMLVMFTLFASIFWIAQPAMDLVDGGFSTLADSVAGLDPNALWAQFLSGGVIAGGGAVLVFVPQIFILFLGLNFLEDSGYLARAATLVDKPFSKLGLNGRSFVPLLSGHACAIPAMMAARTIPSRRERFLTLFLIPLMNCSARLPVYALLLAFLFAGQPSWKPALTLLAIYFLSLLGAAVVSILVQSFLPKDKRSWFLMELPLYRPPKFKHVLHNAFARTKSYLQRAGPTILVISIGIWVLSTFPNYQEADSAKRLETSYLSSIGHGIEPLMTPMGTDWRVGVGLLAAFAAREVFVSTMGVIFHVEGDDDETLQSGLLAQMREAKNSAGEPIFTFASVAALIMFFMISLQCLSTVAVARKETASWGFALAQLTVFTLGAYLLAVGVFQFIS